MIYRNLAQGKDTLLLTLAIKINQPSKAAYQFFFNGFVDNPKQATLQFERWMKQWIKKELSNFAKQRDKALKEVGMLSMAMIARIQVVNMIANSGCNHKELCELILKHQDDIRLLVPSSNSRYYGWHFIIEEIIHYCHESLSKVTLNKFYHENPSFYKSKA